jgi:hypothetical protein
MAMDHVEPCYVRARWDGILVDAKATRIGEVRAEYAQALEDIVVLIISSYGYLSLQGRVGDVRNARERC